MGMRQHLGVVGAAASVAMAAALQAVDGVALKVMVDRWAQASGEARARAFEGAVGAFLWRLAPRLPGEDGVA